MSAVEQCPYRDRVEFNGSEESCRCRLLCVILNCGQDLSSFRVPRSACEACVAGVPPAADRLNPVVASFVFSAAVEIIELGGTATCDTTRAAEIQDWAQSFVEVEVSGGRIPQARPRTFRDCCYLGRTEGYQQQPSVQGLVRTPVYKCHHPAHGPTTEAACSMCHEWSRTLGSAVVKLADLLPQPASWRAVDPIQWAVGITTTQRRIPTLETSMDYLRRAGWDDVLVAVDGMTDLSPAKTVEKISLRSPATGAWPNFYLTLLELVLSEPDADAVMMLQDDAKFYDRENVREYLESIFWPSEPQGIISLYCSAAYTRETPAWTMAEQRWEWGALAFVFPKELARQFVCDSQVIQHRFTDRGLRFIDDVIGEWAQRSAIPIWYPSPSLVQHIGDTSTVWHGVPAEGYRRADSFVGDL